MDQLRAENAALRAALGAVSAAQAAIPHLNPATALRPLAELQAQVAALKAQGGESALPPTSTTNGATTLPPLPSSIPGLDSNKDKTDDPLNTALSAKDDAS